MLTRRLAILGGIAVLAAPAVASPTLQSKRTMTDGDLLAYLEPRTSHREIGSFRAASLNRLLARRLGMPNVFPEGTLHSAKLDTCYTMEVAYDGRMPEGAEQEILDALIDALAVEVSSIPDFYHLVALIPNVIIDPVSIEPIAVFRLHYLRQ